MTQLDDIPGIGVTAARVVIAEIGTDMSRFPTPAHLASWARFAPGVKESAGRKKGRCSRGFGVGSAEELVDEAIVRFDRFKVADAGVVYVEGWAFVCLSGERQTRYDERAEDAAGPNMG